MVVFCPNDTVSGGLLLKTIKTFVNSEVITLILPQTEGKRLKTHWFTGKGVFTLQNGGFTLPDADFN
jgi:hypothetical protein